MINTDGWLDHWSIRSKMLLIFGVALGLYVIALTVIGSAQRRQDEARAWTIHTYQVIAEAGAVDRAMRESQVGVRGFLLGGGESEVKLLEASREDFDSHFAELRRMTMDNPLQQSRLDLIGVEHGRWQTEVADAAIAEVRRAVAAGTRGLSPDEVAAHGFLENGRQRVAQIFGTLNEIRTTEQTLLEARSRELAHAVRSARNTTLGALLGYLLLAPLGIRAFIRQITRPIGHLTELMTRLAKHDHRIEVPGQARGDEIGAIARALEVFRNMALETHDNNWVKSRVNEIATAAQVARLPRELAGTLLGAIAPQLGVGRAAFYVNRADTGQIERLAGYGFDARETDKPRYQPGEGLVGQCASERRTLVITGLPADYFPIQSGLGQAAPGCVTLLPLINRDRLLGVIELAAFQPLPELHRRYLDELLPILALTLENLLRAARTQQLLEETQTQSEELQASSEALQVGQEELRATNETLQENAVELERQSARLRSSEEELRAQTEELRVANEELREKTARLNAQKEQLENLQGETQTRADALARASQYKSDFLANMSHELRTPLNSLLILSRGLADNEDGNLSVEQIESSRIIFESGSNLLRLINDILDLSKIEAGKMEVVEERLSLASFADRLTRNFRPVAASKQLDFSIELEPGLPEEVRTDAGKLEQIVSNLLSNAFKFTAAGGVRVRIGRPAVTRVLPPGLSTAECVTIAVQDSGIGIAEDKAVRIFQAFEQGEAGTSRQYGGTGLGLSIARSMIRLLGGDISMDSRPGVGSTFTVLLPDRPVAGRAALAPAADTVPHPAAAVPVSVAAPSVSAAISDDRETLVAGETVILIVEDDPAFQRILADMVRRKGFKALLAGDGESAVELAKRFQPTGVLLDVGLPGIDGWTVMERLKAGVATRHIPVHFISGHDEQGRGLGMGAVGFMTKPVSRDSIGQAFERLLHFAPGAPRRVLVIDDDAGARAAVRALIADPQVECLEAGSGEQALKLMQGDTRLDCVILDLGLPGMDGFEFLDRAAAFGPVPPVVVYSGRELSREENLRLHQYTDSIVIKGARSPERLLDEVTLFLHSIRTRPTPPPRELDAQLNGRTVLVVDDDMRNIFALSKALRARGLKVLMAQDGHKALRQLGDNADIGLVLMDIMMPGMDGYETMREVRKEPRFATLPIIALTAKAMRGDREKCLEAGANDYLSKPIDIDKLLSMMRVWVS